MGKKVYLEGTLSEYAMIATAKGFFDGQQIVLEPPVQLEAGQEVVIAYPVVASSKKKESKGESR